MHARSFRQQKGTQYERAIRTSPHVLLGQEQEDPETRIQPGIYKRIAGYATRHKRKLIIFLLLSVLTAGIGVLNPVLAGDVVNAITGGGPVSTVVWLAVAIGGLAIADAAISITNRYLSSRIGEDSSSICARPSTITSSRCRSHSSAAPAPAPWSPG